MGDDSMDMKGLAMRAAAISLFGILMMLAAVYVGAQDGGLTATEAADAGGGEAIVSINGSLITRAEFERALAGSAVESSADSGDARMIEVLNAMIEQEVIAQFAEEHGIGVGDEELDAEVERLRGNRGEMDGEARLADGRYAQADFRAAVHGQMLAGRVRDYVTAGLDGMVEHAHARHILVATQAEAQAALGRLAAGEDFASLAAEVSLDVTSRAGGGDLGWFIRGELLDAILTETAFSIEVGTLAGPLVTGLGYHILETLDKAPRAVEARRMPFLAETIFNRWLAEAVMAADIIFNL